METARTRAPDRTDLNITLILLAAGASSRMKGVDKLLETIDGLPLLRRAALACVNSMAREVRVVIRPDDRRRESALNALPLRVVKNPAWRDGLSSSIKSGLRGIGNATDGVLIALADMPRIGAGDFDALINAFDPESGKTICRAEAGDGTPGNPVLIGRRHFGALETLGGDRGARALIAANPDAVRHVTLAGQAATLDLDTPADWAAYRRGKTR